MATTLYTQLSFEQYKVLEEALLRFKELETTHTSTSGFYHKAFRLPVGDCVFEFHGPIVKAAEKIDEV